MRTVKHLYIIRLRIDCNNRTERLFSIVLYLIGYRDCASITNDIIHEVGESLDCAVNSTRVSHQLHKKAPRCVRNETVCELSLSGHILVGISKYTVTVFVPCVGRARLAVQSRVTCVSAASRRASIRARAHRGVRAHTIRRRAALRTGNKAVDICRHGIT